MTVATNSRRHANGTVQRPTKVDRGGVLNGPAATRLALCATSQLAEFGLAVLFTQVGAGAESAMERVPNIFRYRVTGFGLRIALFFTRIYNRLLRPASAAALPGLRAVPAPLQRAFITLATQIDAAIKLAQLATSNLTHLRKVSFVKQR